MVISVIIVSIIMEEDVEVQLEDIIGELDSKIEDISIDTLHNFSEQFRLSYRSIEEEMLSNKPRAET